MTETTSVTGAQAALAIWPGLFTGSLSLSDKRGVSSSGGDSCQVTKHFEGATKCSQVAENV